MRMVASGLGTRCLPLACPSWTARNRSVRVRAHQSNATMRLSRRTPVARSTQTDGPTGRRQNRLLAAQEAPAQSPILPRSGLPRSCPPALRPRLASRQVRLLRTQDTPSLETADQLSQLEPRHPGCRYCSTLSGVKQCWSSKTPAQSNCRSSSTTAQTQKLPSSICLGTTAQTCCTSSRELSGN